MKKVDIWNHQLIRYAGYETEHGVYWRFKFNRIHQAMYGIRVGREIGSFDILPLVVQVDGKTARLYEIPERPR